MSEFIANSASVVAFAGAVFLAYNGCEGWGWLIFAGVICSKYG